MFDSSLAGTLAAWAQHRESPLVLAVVVRTEGSSYRRPGAFALFGEQGILQGAISGGCVEPHLEMSARECLALGCARLLSYDSRDPDDDVFGYATGCAGRTEVLLLPLDREGGPLPMLHDAQTRHRVCELAFVLSADALGAGSACCGDRTVRWSAPGLPSASAVAREQVRLQIAPPLHLLLLGAGPEAPALIRLAKGLGWCVSVIEHRERYRSGSRLEGATLLGARVSMIDAALASRVDAAIVMSHHIPTDAAALEALAHTSIPYLGLLGPPARRDALLQPLDETLRHTLLPRLHAPIGLDLGGEGPEAIALSVVSQLQSLFGRRGNLRRAGSAAA